MDWFTAHFNSLSFWKCCSVRQSESRDGKPLEYRAHWCALYRFRQRPLACNWDPASAASLRDCSRSSGRNSELFRTCHRCSASTPELRCCTLPSRVPSPKRIVEFSNWSKNNNHYFGKMKLKWIIGGERNDQTAGEKFRQRIPVVIEEERVVAERWHGDSDLAQIVKILQHWHLSQ